MVIGFEFCYSEKVYMSCRDSYGNEMVKHSEGFMTMDKAIEAANILIEDFGFVEVACCNAGTGEVIFIARAHAEEGVEEVDDNSLYYDDPDEWMDEVGFDPYEGCYTFDC
jgi:hypothetical protein